MGINKVHTRWMVTILKRRKTRCQLIKQICEYLNTRTWKIESKLRMPATSTWNLKVDCDIRSRLGEAAKVNKKQKSIIGRSHSGSLYRSASSSRSIRKTFAECEEKYNLLALSFTQYLKTKTHCNRLASVFHAPTKKAHLLLSTTTAVLTLKRLNLGSIFSISIFYDQKIPHFLEFMPWKSYQLAKEKCCLTLSTQCIVPRTHHVQSSFLIE